MCIVLFVTMNSYIWNCFLIIVLIEYSSTNTLIDNGEENLVTDVINSNGVIFTSIKENVDPDLIRYINDAGVVVYLQKPAKETKNDNIVYSLTKTKTDGSANWFLYATSKGSTREETSRFVKGTNEKESLDVEGTYSYVGNDGVRYMVGYSAGENGYRPKVLFGTQVDIVELPVPDVGDRIMDMSSKMDKKGAGDTSSFMCSLIGSGCI